MSLTYPAEFPRNELRVVYKLGDGQYSEEVHVCEVNNFPDYLNNDVENQNRRCKFVVQRTLRNNSSEQTKLAFLKEVKFLGKLDHVNIAKVLGICMDDKPPSVVIEYAEHGDLFQFLQEHVAETASPLAPAANTLR